MQETQKSTKKKRQIVAVSKKSRSAIIRKTMTDFMEHATKKAIKSTEKKSKNPFNLLPNNICKVCKLERTYSTSSGTILIQKLAAELAEANFGYGRTNYTIDGRINIERMRRLNNIINSLESTGARPNFEEEIAYILAGKSRRTIRVVVNVDVYAVNRRENHSRIAIECKSPLANNDQARTAKERIFKLYSMEDSLVDEAYFALNYNPYGNDRSSYSWSPPNRWFNIKKGDPSVLIGTELWDKIGGPGTYKLIEKISEEVKNTYADAINKKFVLF